MVQVSGQLGFVTDENENEYVQFFPDNTENLMLEEWSLEGVAHRLKNEIGRAHV